MSGFAMFQQQIKAVHESVQEDKQRLDQNESDRRPRVTTHSPTVLEREGESDLGVRERMHKNRSHVVN